MAVHTVDKTQSQAALSHLEGSCHLYEGHTWTVHCWGGGGLLAFFGEEFRAPASAAFLT